PALVSLIPLSQKAKGVTLEGDFKYPLSQGTLGFGLTLGVSNELRGGEGLVLMGEGALAVFVQPLGKSDA
ncbi:MAG: hypothetical protein LBE13_02255, partial [Bacteroidales bacterium]|nr:hypothetical protein [Bacteroidales bacterium]